MNQKRLEEYLDIKREVRFLRQRIDELVCMSIQQEADIVSASQVGYPYLPYKLTIIGMPEAKEDRRQNQIKRLEQRYKRRLQKYQQEQEEIEAFIESVESSIIRQIITLRYIDGMTWLQVAFRVDKTDEQWPRRKLKKFFENDENDERTMLKCN